MPFTQLSAIAQQHPNRTPFTGVKISPQKAVYPTARFSISRDVAASFNLKAGTRVNVSKGEGRDTGLICISPTNDDDPHGYKLRGSYHQVVFCVVQSKLYTITEAARARIVSKPEDRMLIIELPTSIVPRPIPTISRQQQGALL